MYNRIRWSLFCTITKRGAVLARQIPPPPLHLLAVFVQLFITYSDLGHLGKPGSPWETPVGIVTKGMNSVVDKFYQGYGDQQPFNKDGISQVKLQQRGNEYLRCGRTQRRKGGVESMNEGCFYSVVATSYI